MVNGSGLGVRISVERVPILAETLDFASMGLVPAGAHRNREFRQHMVAFAPAIDAVMQDVLFDPQTSGGLLISVAGAQSEQLVTALRQAGVKAAVTIGEVVAEEEKIVVT
jgi:selenide,water dikinase